MLNDALTTVEKRVAALELPGGGGVGPLAHEQKLFSNGGLGLYLYFGGHCRV